MFDDKQRIAELEAEMTLLRRTTSLALEKSWEEVERLQREYEESEMDTPSNGMDLSVPFKCIDDRRTIGQKKMSATDLTADTMSVITDDTTMSSVAEYFDSAQTWRISIPSLTSNLGVTSRWAAAKCKRVAAIQTSIEKDLMRQLEVLQQDKLHTEQELLLKIKQRESAIATLEGTVVLQDQTIQNLRNEMDELRNKYESVEEAKHYKSSRPRTENALRKNSASSARLTDSSGHGSPLLGSGHHRKSIMSRQGDPSLLSSRSSEHSTRKSSFNSRPDVGHLDPKHRGRIPLGKTERSRRSSDNMFHQSSQCLLTIESDLFIPSDASMEELQQRGRSYETQLDCSNDAGLRRRGKSCETTYYRGERGGFFAEFENEHECSSNSLSIVDAFAGLSPPRRSSAQDRRQSSARVLETRRGIANAANTSNKKMDLADQFLSMDPTDVSNLFLSSRSYLDS